MVPHCISVERWKSKNGADQAMSQSHKGINLTLKIEGIPVAFKHEAPSDSHRTLVFHLLGDGQPYSHKKLMREKA
jgi:hypothetical protein